jgi:hypothetical protein
MEELERVELEGRALSMVLPVSPGASQWIASTCVLPYDECCVLQLFPTTPPATRSRTRTAVLAYSFAKED